MSDLYVVLEMVDLSGGTELGYIPSIDAYGIFNDKEEAEQFVRLRCSEDDLVTPDDFVIVPIVPATRHGLL